MPSSIPHSRPQLGAPEARAVERVLRSGQIAGGPEVERLEREFAEQFGYHRAVALASGTAGLHLLLLALDLGADDRIGIPSYVCTSLLHAVRAIGAREQLCDSAPSDPNASWDGIAADSPIQLAIAPHMFGHPVALGPLLERRIPIIEDCAMAIGGHDANGQLLGHVGLAAVYSFYATKPVAAGEGGLVATDDEGLADELLDRRSYDKKTDWKLRFNYKLTDLQAALARCQLRKLKKAIERRRRVAERYCEELRGHHIGLPSLEKGATHQRFIVRLPLAFDVVEGFFRERKIDIARPVYCPLHRLLGLAPETFPNSETLFLTAVSLPIYPTLSVAEQRRVVNTLRALVNA